jgi:hypothetical protein
MYKYFLEYNNKKIEIDEPIGWDDLELVLSRNETSHGIDVEHSDLSLKFYGNNAVTLLEEAYDADIDSVVILSCEYNGNEEYRGQLDFEKYGKYFESGYCYITASVHEVSIQALFNNRIEQKADIDSLASFEGINLTDYPMLKKEIEFPAKDVESATRAESGDFTIFNDLYNELAGFAENITVLLSPFFEKTVYEETGIFYAINNPSVLRSSNINQDKFKLISFTEKELNTFVGDITVKGEINFLLDMYYPKNMSNSQQDGNLTMSLVLSNGKQEVIIWTGQETIQWYNINDPNDQPLLHKDVTFQLAPFEVTLPATEILYFAIRFQFEYPNTSYTMNERRIIIKRFSVYGAEEMQFFSYIEIFAIQKYPNSRANVSFVHEVLSRIVESISNNQLNVKSDYYGRTDSNINPSSVNGKGSFRALTTGLRIRNARDINGNDKPFIISFSDLIKGLIPVDNIGFGMSNEEGVMYLRVEPWQWFYKSDVIFEINNPSKYQRVINTKETFSIFKCGYKKYELGEAHGLDAFHTEREYRTRLKLNSKTIEKLSELIADSFVIEFTRRKAIEKDTEDWKYDDNVFIICLCKNSSGYIIDQGIIDSENTIVSPTTIYNARISPSRMIKKWSGRILQLGFGKNEDLIFTSGTGNFLAKGKANTSITGNEYADLDNSLYIENQNFTDNDIILLPETIKVDEYPLTGQEYNSIKINPYGIIKVNETPCHIREIKYKRQKGTASFELIPAANG